MYSLDSIVGGILSQLASAQSYSDAATLSTGYKYAEHKHLQYFDIPQISIFEADVELKFAFAIDKNKPSIISFNALMRDTFIKELKEIISSLQYEQRFIAIFNISVKDKHKWQTAVDSMLATVKEKIDNDAPIELNQFLSTIIFLIKSKIIANFVQNKILDKIKYLYKKRSANNETELWLEQLNSKIRNMIFAILKINALDTELSVMVTHEELSAIPANMVSKITFKAGLNKKQWLHEDDLELGGKKLRLVEK